MRPSPHSQNCSPKRLRVAAVQMTFADSIEGNLEKIERAAIQAAKDGVDAVLFPECATTGYAYNFDSLEPDALRRALRTVAAVAANLRINLLIGSPIFAGRRLYNGLVVFDRGGHLVHTYAKCQQIDADRRWFTPGNGLSLFSIDGVRATSIICHERRYPELVRLPVMAGAQIVFHANAGMDALVVSRTKHGGRDGIPVRAFENGIFYVFANSVGPQGGGKWSAGDSKIVAPDGSSLRLANNRHESVILGDLEMIRATRKYGLDSLEHPHFLAAHWRRMLPVIRRRVRENDRRFRRWYGLADSAPDS